MDENRESVLDIPRARDLRPYEFVLWLRVMADKMERMQKESPLEWQESQPLWEWIDELWSLV